MDLHIHSTHSDGQLTPSEIIHIASSKGINVLSITDHDEIAAYHSGKRTANFLGITLIPGIELNTDGEDGELHILGYYINPYSETLLNYIAWRKKERTDWAKKIVNKLRDMGYNISFDACARRAKGGVIVRTHIADELFSKGYFPSSEHAYGTLLIKGATAFVKRADFTAEDAIQLIHDAGGEAYLAHPGIYPFDIHIQRLIAYGLDGIEVYHSKHKQAQIAYWEKIAQQASLKVSGGSNHHGPQSFNPYPIGSVLLSDFCIKQWTAREPIT
ncbi:PHP domain-containing protein [Aquibacillus rhizosphaerae]|uniref:PHP domain-containing protein n=1 Tax=Aquibacillus rhizosphaerae TaxID=3051431 RepID=A0ABT7LBV0_9BACI|nr:PHP domain-containing protein [Aquibacillus sp. LR5S19]MDL4842675.1 PHP domain-containing protein [Aquibacillus sp. LR5S19]